MALCAIHYPSRITEHCCSKAKHTHIRVVMGKSVQSISSEMEESIYWNWKFNIQPAAVRQRNCQLRPRYEIEVNLRLDKLSNRDRSGFEFIYIFFSFSLRRRIYIVCGLLFLVWHTNYIQVIYRVILSVRLGYMMQVYASWRRRTYLMSTSVFEYSTWYIIKYYYWHHRQSRTALDGVGWNFSFPYCDLRLLRYVQQKCIRPNSEQLRRTTNIE